MKNDAVFCFVISIITYMIGALYSFILLYNPNVPDDFLEKTKTAKAECEANLTRNSECVLVWKFVPETKNSHIDEE